MGKYYVREINAELFDWEDYLDEETLEERNIMLGGNNDFTTLNYEIASGIYSMIQDLGYDFDTDSDDGYANSDMDEEEYSEWITGKVRDYLNMIDSESTANNLSEDDLNEIANEITSVYGNPKEYNDSIATILSILYKTKFTHGTIHGSSQGDWQNYFAPESENMDYIEAVYFGTGTELQITIDKYDSEPDMMEVDTYFDYTEEYSDQKIKEHVAKIQHCSVNEVELIK